MRDTQPLPQPKDPKDWQAKLDELYPPTDDRLCHMHLVWEPGYEWRVVNRWFIYRSVSREHMSEALFLNWLNGPDPMDFYQYDKRKPVGQRLLQRSDAPLIGRNTWLMWRASGRFALPYWVIQGTKGGHPHEFTQIEERWAKLMEQPTEPPVPGMLSYAEPSHLVWDALRRRDEFSISGMKIDQLENQDELQSGDRQLLQELRQAAWDKQIEQFEEIGEMVKTEYADDISRIHKSGFDHEGELEKMHEEYVTSTEI